MHLTRFLDKIFYGKTGGYSTLKLKMSTLIICGSKYHIYMPKQIGINLAYVWCMMVKENFQKEILSKIVPHETPIQALG